MFRFYISLLLVFLLTSCKENNLRANNVKIELYFHELEYLHTVIPLDCDSFLKERGIKKLTISDNDEVYKLLLTLDENPKFIDFSSPDVRYKIVINKNVYCIPPLPHESFRVVIYM